MNELTDEARYIGSLQHPPNLVQSPAVGPDIVISVDFDRAYIDRYGIEEARKMMIGGLFSRGILEVFTAGIVVLGKARLEDIRATAIATTGIVAVRVLTINGEEQDFIAPPDWPARHGMYPRSVDMRDVRIV